MRREGGREGGREGKGQAREGEGVTVGGNKLGTALSPSSYYDLHYISAFKLYITSTWMGVSFLQYLHLFLFYRVALLHLVFAFVFFFFFLFMALFCFCLSIVFPTKTT